MGSQLQIPFFHTSQLVLILISSCKTKRKSLKILLINHKFVNICYTNERYKDLFQNGPCGILVHSAECTLRRCEESHKRGMFIVTHDVCPLQFDWLPPDVQPEVAKVHTFFT